VIDSQIIFAIIALNAWVLAVVFFGTFIFSETVRSSPNDLPTRAADHAADWMIPLSPLVPSGLEQLEI
jgi:hypothetical protein